MLLYEYINVPDYNTRWDFDQVVSSDDHCRNVIEDSITWAADGSMVPLFMPLGWLAFAGVLCALLLINKENNEQLTLDQGLV